VPKNLPDHWLLLLLLLVADELVDVRERNWLMYETSGNPTYSSF
jgi:hypothetical protein